MNQKSLFITAAALAALIGLIGYVHNARTATYSGQTLGFKVACIKGGTSGQDQALAPYYHIAHSSGSYRCYFRFTSAAHMVHMQESGLTGSQMASKWNASDVKCGNVRRVRKYPVRFGSHSRMSCAFTNDEHYNLINALRSPVSYSTYGGVIVRFPCDVARYLAPEVPLEDLVSAKVCPKSMLGQ